MFFLSDLSSFGRRRGSKDRKLRKRGALLISDKPMDGYRPVQTTYISSTSNPNRITRIQYQQNAQGKTAFLGKPKRLNEKEKQTYFRQGYIKGDYKANGEKY